MTDTTIETSGAATRFPPHVLVPLALVSVYLIWGSTYLAIRIALESYPPFSMAAVRFLAAGAALYAFLRWRGAARLTALQWRNCAITGTLLLGFGNGMVCWAQQSVSSGLAAIAVAGMPLFAALFGTAFGQWPRRLEWTGLLVGFVGVILLNVGGDLAGSRLGALALLTATASWAFGSIWSKRQDMPEPMMSTAAQMLTGGAALTVLALLNGQGIPAAPTLRATMALVYLGIFGSIIAFSAYIYLLGTVRPALATSYAYVNPPVAVLFGVVLANERVHLLDLVGMAVILGGVAIITLARDKR